jgi:hypothetical protein
MPNRFSKAILEFDGGKYSYSCDVCGRVTHEVFPIYFGEHGEKLDLCRRCLERDDWGERW